MTKVFFYLFLKPISLLPLNVLYAITYPFYLIAAYLIQYRKKVILKNLQSSFPERSYKDLIKIKKLFYRHFFDQMIESVKMISMSDRECLKRFVLTNPELLDPYYNQDRNIAMVIGHYNNWEFTPIMNGQMNHQFVAIYTPLGNTFMDKKVYDTRSKLGSKLVSKRDVGSFIRKAGEKPFLLMFAADQSPNWRSKIHWTTFLNQNTAVATGTERYAKMLDMPVVFGRIEKERRGYYKMTMEILTDKPKSEPEGRITELHVRSLENQIIDQPYYWLWTHKRWKMKQEKN